MRAFAALMVGLVIAACESGGSSSSTSSSSGGVAGATCVDDTSCVKGLHCFVSTDAVEGKCEALPAACAESADCQCLADAHQSSCPGVGRCSARIGYAVYACPTTVRRKEGEACSEVRGCERGLLCRVLAQTRVGTCEKFPASCAENRSCECLKTEGCPGADLRTCSIVGEDAAILCE